MIDTKQLRCNVLDLALRGKLTHQNPEDDARDLLKRVNAKRNIEQNDNVPYTLPCNWAWVKIKDLFNINPKVDAEDEAKAAFIPMEKISAGFSEEFSYEEQIWKIASKNHTKFADGDVAFAKISPCFENRKSFVAKNLPNGIGGGTTELIVLRQPELFAEYIYLLIIDQRFIKSGSSSYKGIVGQQRIKPDSYKEYLVPIAPMEEQKRIVTIVQAAFDILDQIDKLQQQYSSDLEVLKSKFIDAGIQGKLTEQLPEDGTAEELLGQIKEEKKTLEDAGVYKNKKKIVIKNSILNEDVYDIPKTWKWVRLGQLADVYGRIGFRGYTKADLVEQGQGAISMSPSNITFSGDVVFENNTYISWGKYDESPEIKVRKGDVLIVKTGSSYGKTGIIEEMPEKCTINPQLAILKNILCDRHYLNFYMKSSHAWSQYKSFVVGAATPTFSQEKLANMLIPLPPLREQKRIVDKIDEMLSIVQR